MALNGFEHAPRRRALQPDGLAKGPAHPFLVQPGHQVDQHPGGGRDWDADVAGYLAVEHLRPVYEDPTVPSPPAPPRARDHLIAAFEAVEAVAGTGAAMAQHRSGSSQDRGEPKLCPGHRPMRQGVDTEVEGARSGPADSWRAPVHGAS